MKQPCNLKCQWDKLRRSLFRWKERHTPVRKQAHLKKGIVLALKVGLILTLTNCTYLYREGMDIFAP